MNHCPHCGERVESRDAYCFECGTELGEASGEAAGRRRSQDPDQQEASLGSSRGESQYRNQQRAQGQYRDQSRHQRQGRPRGESQQPQPRPRGRGAGYGQETVQTDAGGGVESLTTVWVAAGLSVVALVESVSAILFADEVVSLVEDSGFGGEVSADVVAIGGGVGAVVALLTGGLCAYFYREGYVDRRFFWGLIAGGVAGLLFGNAFSFLILIGVGAYGLLVVLKRDQSGGQPSRV